MKTARLLLIFTGLLVAIWCWYAATATSAGHAVALGKSPGAVPHVCGPQCQAHPKSALPPRPLSKRKELEARIEARLAQAVATRSLQKELLLAESWIRSREASYRRLFDKWGLESSRVDEIFQFLKDRRLLLDDARHRRNLAGIDGFKQPLQKNELVEIELEVMLGQERYYEFVALETDLDKSSLQEAAQIVPQLRDVK